ncbi:hypothetical protein AB1Y20_020228 [Prymnesium parvum]|uniref:Sulfotransferase n=1 Tax=Prymnesium parvum TaxID=97485 RepID=A0AB34JWR2_PRYPA
MLVRNPYARLISGFKDKVVARPRVSKAGNISRRSSAGIYSKRLKNVPIMPDTPSAFGAFALSVFDRRQRNPHFTLQSDACGLAKGLKYEYYLKQENIDDWYSTLINVMELASVGGCRGKFEVVLPSKDRYFCGWWKSRSPCGRQYVFAKTSCQCYSKEGGNALAALLPAHEQRDILVRGSTLDARVSFLEQKLDRLLSLLSTIGKL